MPANVETMFYTRVAPWHGLGVRVENALSSEDALKASGLNREVFQQLVFANLMIVFSKTIEGNPLIDKAYAMALEAV